MVGVFTNVNDAGRVQRSAKTTPYFVTVADRTKTKLTGGWPPNKQAAWLKPLVALQHFHVTVA